MLAVVEATADRVEVVLAAMTQHGFAFSYASTVLRTTSCAD